VCFAPFFVGMKAIDMTTESSLPVTKLIIQGLLEEVRVHGWTWRARGVVFGLCCGIISPLIGSVLTAAAWFTGPKWHGLFLQRDGTLLLFLTIPLLILGAHCLDLLEQKNNR
jgi:hypothetical protein